MLRAPAGHRRNGPGFLPLAGNVLVPRWWAALREAGTVAEAPHGQRPEKLLRCPAGAWPFLCANRGLRPLARSCPRLISYGVPPGRGADCRAQISPGPNAAGVTVGASRCGKPLAGRERRRTAPAQILSGASHHRDDRTAGRAGSESVSNFDWSSPMVSLRYSKMDFCDPSQFMGPRSTAGGRLTHRYFPTLFICWFFFCPTVGRRAFEEAGINMKAPAFSSAAPASERSKICTCRVS